MKMNKLIKTGIMGLTFSVLVLIGYYCEWGVEGTKNAWLLNPVYVAAVVGFFVGSGTTLICLGLPRRKHD